MTIVDANLLLYAYNADAPQQSAASRWLEELLQSEEGIGLPWVTIWAFLRIATNSRIWSNPLSAQQAFAIVEKWLAQPGVVLLQPGPRHAGILQKLLSEYRVTGPLVMDAVMAALAIENGARLASTDHDFRRFPELRWTNPLSQE
ncbi:MAG: type II toxin-antitoxin system VapC family toxin [Bryobacteraceae bacterium]|nr:type II toxin-antitoxin system VapC family toxin [Bryobacteraceae bacterium]